MTIGAVIKKSWIDNEWIENLILAACRGHDPELWFPLDRGKVDIENRRKAKEICDACPIEVVCLEMTLTPTGIKAGWEFGMYGGLTGKQRKRLVKKRIATEVTNGGLVDAG